MSFVGTVAVFITWLIGGYLQINYFHIEDDAYLMLYGFAVGGIGLLINYALD